MKLRKNKLIIYNLFGQLVQRLPFASHKHHSTIIQSNLIAICIPFADVSPMSSPCMDSSSRWPWSLHIRSSSQSTSTWLHPHSLTCPAAIIPPGRTVLSRTRPRGMDTWRNQRWTMDDKKPLEADEHCQAINSWTIKQCLYWQLQALHPATKESKHVWLTMGYVYMSSFTEVSSNARKSTFCGSNHSDLWKDPLAPKAARLPNMKWWDIEDTDATGKVNGSN